MLALSGYESDDYRGHEIAFAANQFGNCSFAKRSRERRFPTDQIINSLGERIQFANRLKGLWIMDVAEMLHLHQCRITPLNLAMEDRIGIGLGKSCLPIPNGDNLRISASRLGFLFGQSRVVPQ